MSGKGQTKETTKGPQFLKIWKTKAGDQGSTTTEYPFYSDARIVGETLCFGPYSLLEGNLDTGQSVLGRFRPSLVFRCTTPSDFSFFNPEDHLNLTTEHGGYHGGQTQDEIAALLSLALGVRIKAGQASRQFFAGGDPLGTPRLGSSVPLSFDGYDIPKIRSAIKDRNLKEAKDILETSGTLAEESAMKLVIAARSYQSALWVAEYEPSTAWLFFVSAIETAAGAWAHKDIEPLEKVKRWNEGVYKALVTTGEENAKRVAQQISRNIGSTRKFTDFLMEFKPEAPLRRPEVETSWGVDQGEFWVPWNDRYLKSAFNTIYDYRSKALHAGNPFPLPMCQAPGQTTRDGPPIERPFKGWSSAWGGQWKSKDLPMYLHIFEFVVRQSLLNWWRSMKSND